MSVFHQLTCLQESGIISAEEADSLKSIVAKLPSSEHDLTQMIAAITIMNSNPASRNNPLGDESASSENATDIVDLSAIPQGATKAFVSVLANNINYRVDGGNPSATTGHPVVANSSFWIHDLQSFKFVAQTASTAHVFVTYY